MKKYLLTIILSTILVLSFVTSEYRILGYALLVVQILSIIDKLGKGIVLRESIALLYTLTCIIMPFIGYDYYTIGEKISRIWVGYMRVPEDRYFAYALPAVVAFTIAINWPLKRESDSGEALLNLLNNVRRTINKHAVYTGPAIMIAGFIAYFIVGFLPEGLRFFVNLLYFSSFAGFMYTYYVQGKGWRLPAMLMFALFVFSSALTLGMFTIVVYMTITIYAFFYFGNKASFLRKLMVFLFALFFVVVLQNAKGAYRKFVWQSGYAGNKAELFVNLFVENFQKGDALIERQQFFPVYVRFNQGYNVSLVMRRFPSVKPFDNGERLTTVILSSFVPRFLWNDKPEAGGVFNMEYYAGKKIKGWSTNVGPLGEAYGSFGLLGGGVYMALLGFVIRWVYGYLFSLSRKTPLLVCWIPVLFFQVTYSAETDTLQVFNSLVKTAFFIWLLYKLIPSWFGVGKSNA